MMHFASRVWLTISVHKQVDIENGRIMRINTNNALFNFQCILKSNLVLCPIQSKSMDEVRSLFILLIYDIL